MDHSFFMVAYYLITISVFFAGGGHLGGVCVPYDEVLCTQHKAHTCGKSKGGYGEHGQCGK